LGPRFCGLRVRPAISSRRPTKVSSPSGRLVRPCRRRFLSSPSGMALFREGKGGQARLFGGSLIGGNLSWPVRRSKSRFQPELFGRATDPILAAVWLAARHTTANRLHFRLRLWFVDEIAPAPRIRQIPFGPRLDLRHGTASLPEQLVRHAASLETTTTVSVRQ